MTTVASPASVALNTMKNLLGGEGQAQDAGNGAGGPSFGDILKTSLNSAIDAQHTSEKVSAAALVGKASMTDVLQAVNSAELALNTVLAIRDKVVTAYQSIMQTPI